MIDTGHGYFLSEDEYESIEFISLGMRLVLKIGTVGSRSGWSSDFDTSREGWGHPLAEKSLNFTTRKAALVDAIDKTLERFNSFSNHEYYMPIIRQLEDFKQPKQLEIEF